jgi:hypothetical protein
LVVESNAYLRAMVPMPTSSPPPVRDYYRRALALLDSSPDGATEAVMLAHGFPIELLVELVDAGLATANMRADAGEIEVTRVITANGRRALALLKGK